MDLFIAVDASESIIIDDPYGKPLYNWNRVSILFGDFNARIERESKIRDSILYNYHGRFLVKMFPNYNKKSVNSNLD